MILRQSSVTDEYNRPVPGATVYVYDQSGAEATLTSDGVTPLAQPVTTDQFGTYSYFAVDDYYREDTWFAGKLRYREVVPVGNPGADLALRFDLAQPSGPDLIGVGNGSALSDVIRVNAAAYGFRAARSAAQNLAAIQDAIGDNAGGAHPVIIDIPPDHYNLDTLGITDANIWIDAHGSTFFDGLLSLGPTATGFKLKNARYYVDTASPIITLNSSGGGLHNIDLVKFGAGDGYMLQTEQVTDNVYDTIRMTGGNGAFIEGERLIFDNIHGVGRAAGGDDFFVLKARNRRTGDIVIGTVFAKNYANGIAFGGEVGTLGAASAGRVGRVENVKIGMMTLSETQYGAYFKPGAVDGGSAAYDWRDGLVRGVEINIKITDGSGAKLRRGFVLSAARNALVEFPKINLVGEGRFASSADDECWGQVFLPDSTGWTAGGAGGTIRDAEIDVVGDDIYDGVDNAGPTPGNPPLYGVSVAKQAAGVGTLDRIRIRARINGTKSAGIQVSAGCDNAVTIDRLIGRNLANNPGVATGGIHAESIVRAPGENEIHMANVNSKPIYVAGTGDVIGKRLTMDFNAAAGVDQTLFRQLPHDAWLRKVTGVPKDAVGASGTIYFSIELRAVNGLQYDGTALDGNPLTTFNTTATAAVAFTPFAFPAMPVNIGAGASFEDRFLKAGAVVRLAKTNTGGGQPFVGPVDLHYVQIGPAS